jgi:hypothetical protein
MKQRVLSIMFSAPGCSQCTASEFPWWTQWVYNAGGAMGRFPMVDSCEGVKTAERYLELRW